MLKDIEYAVNCANPSQMFHNFQIKQTVNPCFFLPGGIDVLRISTGRPSELFENQSDVTRAKIQMIGKNFASNKV